MAVRVDDLRAGRERFVLSHTEEVRGARFGRSNGATHLLTRTRQDVTCWDADRRSKIYDFSEGADIAALTVQGDYAALAAEKIRLWRFSQNPMDIGAETVRFGADGWAPMRLAFHVSEHAIVFAAAARSTTDSSERLEIWDVERTLASPVLRLAWPVDGEIRNVVMVDATTIVVSRSHSGQGLVEVLSLSANDQFPVVRWDRSLAASAAIGLALLPHGDDPKLLFDDGRKLGIWALAPRLHFASDGTVDVHLPVNVLDNVPGAGSFSADILPAGKANLYFTSDESSDVQRLHSRSIYQGTFGFVAKLVAAGANSGTSALCLWRNIEGSTAGSFIDEEVRSVPVTLKAVNNSGNPARIRAEAEFLQLRFVAFNPDADVESRANIITAARIFSQLANGSLTLYIGEQRLAGDIDHPSEFFAHLVWKTATFELQGPVRLSAPADASTFAVVSGVYRMRPVQNSMAGSTDRDVATPLDNGDFRMLDLVGGEARTSGSVGEFFMSLVLTTAGLTVRLVPDLDIPFDLCLDSGVSAPLPSSLMDVIQLVHRQVLGARLRHQPPATSSGMLTPTSATTVAPPHTGMWSVAPIVQDGDLYRILTNLVFVSSDSTETPTLAPRAPVLQTENLFLLARDDTDADELGAIIGLHNVTAETTARLLLDETAVDERLAKVLAAGAIVQRCLRAAGQGTFRVVPRNMSLSLSGGAGLASATLRSPAAIDFRVVTPREASRLRHGDRVQYRLEDPPAQSELDVSRMAWRRFKVTDVRWPDRPSRTAPVAHVGFLWSERTAFHRMLQPGPAPLADAVFPVAADLPASFRPRTIEVQIAPDKPGAMFHHAVRPIETNASSVSPAPRSLARLPALTTERSTEFALREPMQLAPPLGADIEIKDATRKPIAHRQAERIHVEWKETLGTIPVTATATTVTVTQLDVSTVPDEWPEAKDIRVALTGASVAQSIVKFNDELLEIDSRQPQFPIYDARQSAASRAELADANKAFQETRTVGDRRPFSPKLELPVDDVSIISAESAAGTGLWALAASGFQMRIWRLNVDDPSATQLPAGADQYHVTHDNATPFLAECVTRLGQLSILCNDDGTQSGLFLRRNLLNLMDPTVQLSLAEVKGIRFVEFPSVAHTTGADGDVYTPIRIEVYIARLDDAVNVWYQRSDQTDIQGPITLDHLDAPTTNPRNLLAAASVPHPIVAARSFDHHRLCIAVAFGDNGQIATYEIDFSETAPHTSRFADLSVENLRALSTASLEGAVVVFAGDAQGKVQCLDPVQQKSLKQYNPAPVAVERIATGAAAGRLVIAVGVEKQFDVPRVSVWDAFAGTLLRTTAKNPQGLDDRDYGAVRAVQLDGGVHVFAARTIGDGALQLFDPRLTPYRPPEWFVVTKVNNLTAETSPVSIKYMKVEMSTRTPTEVDVHFKPWLILSDRHDPAVEYHSVLASILKVDPRVPTGGGVRVLTYSPPEEDAPDVNLLWERAGSLRIAWRSTTALDGVTLEAVLDGPQGDKHIKPVPYSAVAPKLAAVVLLDDTSGTPREVWQKTAFFGDAATAGGGQPALRSAGAEFAYEAADRGTIDVPTTAAIGASDYQVLLVKYLVNGQAIGTAQKAQPTS